MAECVHVSALSRSDPVLLLSHIPLFSRENNPFPLALDDVSAVAGTEMCMHSSAPSKQAVVAPC